MNSFNKQTCLNSVLFFVEIRFNIYCWWDRMIESTAVIVALVIETTEQLGHSLPTMLLTISKLYTNHVLLVL